MPAAVGQWWWWVRTIHSPQSPLPGPGYDRFWNPPLRQSAEVTSGFRGFPAQPRRQAEAGSSGRHSELQDRRSRTAHWHRSLAPLSGCSAGECRVE